MKLKTYLSILFLALSFPLTGCGSSSGDDPVPAVTISVSNDALTLPAAGGSQSFTLSANHEWGMVSTPDSWLTVSPSSGLSSGGAVQITVTAAANPNTSSRSASLVFAAGTVRKTVVVTQEAATTAKYDAPAGYDLVWHDEFDGNSLGSDWTEEEKPAGWVNNELQTYIKGNTVNEVKDGNLLIHCYQEGGKVYSGRVYAKPDKGWTYGYFEARIKLPQGKGTWPAFWMMPANNNFSTNPWPGCGEIDIMEEVGADPNIVSSTIHCNKYNNGNTPTEHGTLKVPTAESDYHVYACEWTASKLEFFVDGKSILKYEPTDRSKDFWPFNVPFYPILNLAWGGSWGGYKGVDASALPATMSVDYVRVFQKPTP